MERKKEGGRRKRGRESCRVWPTMYMYGYIYNICVYLSIVIEE